MKKFLLFPLLVFMTAIIVPACSDDEEEIFPPEQGDSTNIGDSVIIGDSIGTGDSITLIKFTGNMIVNGTFKQEGITCIANIMSNTLDLNINKVKFAEAMPNPIDISVPAIPMSKGTEIIFSGDSIVPMIASIPDPAFMFEEIDGTIVTDELNFTAKISGRGAFTFSGKQVK